MYKRNVSNSATYCMHGDGDGDGDGDPSSRHETQRRVLV
jgi:hypothetical protein